MNTEQTLVQRSHSKCELCTAEQHLTIYQLPPHSEDSPENSILLCDICISQISNPETLESQHWHGLKDSMWNPEPAVQVMSWRVLQSLSAESWAQDLLDILYLEPEVLSWAELAPIVVVADDTEATIDNNGTQLSAGDTVTLIKDLDVKGAGFTAKRGVIVKNISLTDNPKHIEGRVNGVRIVLVADYLKKVS